MTSVIIDMEPVRESRSDERFEAHKEFFLWRLIARMNRRMKRLWWAISPAWQQAIQVAAVFVGYVMAYTIFYVALIIAFSYGLLVGFTAMFLMVMFIVKVLQFAFAKNGPITDN